MKTYIQPITETQVLLTSHMMTDVSGGGLKGMKDNNGFTPIKVETGR